MRTPDLIQLLNITKKRWLASCIFPAILLLPATQAHAEPLLRCLVSYAGTTQTIESKISTDPYDAQSVDIGGRFRFKAVMVGANHQPEYIKLYAYFQGKQKDRPIHQATYLAPFFPSSAPLTLTPMNYLYASEVERELQYQCTLQGVQP